MFQNDVEIPIPKYFTHERLKNIKEREKLLGQVLAKIGPQDLERVTGLFLFYFYFAFVFL